MWIRQIKRYSSLRNSGALFNQLKILNIIMDRVRTTFVCCNRHTNNMNSQRPPVLSLFVAQWLPSKYNHDGSNWKRLFQSQHYQHERGWAQTAGNIKEAPCTAVIPEGRCWWGPGNMGDDKSILKEILCEAPRQGPASTLRRETRCKLFMVLRDCHTAHFELSGTWVNQSAVAEMQRSRKRLLNYFSFSL